MYNMQVDSKLQEYYLRFIDLQDKLRKSEEERLQLQMKFQDICQISKEEEHCYYRKLRARYKKFLEDDKKRHDRNDWIISTLKNIDIRIADLHAKTETIKCLKRQCELHTTSFPYYRKDKQQNENEIYIQANDIDLPLFKRNLISNHITTAGICESSKQMNSAEKFLLKNSNTQLDTAMPDKLALGEMEKSFSANQANYIADEIMKSIHSRYYSQNTDSQNRSAPNINNIVQPNHPPVITKKDSPVTGLLPKQLNSGYVKGIHNGNANITSARYSPAKLQSKQQQQDVTHSLDEGYRSATTNNINGHKSDLGLAAEPAVYISNSFSSPVTKRSGKADARSDQPKINQQQKKISKDLELARKENNGNVELKKDADISNLSIKKIDRSRAPTPTKLKPANRSLDASPKKPVARKFKKLVSGIIKNKNPTIPASSGKKDNVQENAVKEKQAKQADIRRVESLDNKQLERKKLSIESSKTSPVSCSEESIVKPSRRQQEQISPHQQIGNSQQELGGIRLDSDNQVYPSGQTYQNLPSKNDQYNPINIEKYENMPHELLENNAQEASQEFYTSEIHNMQPAQLQNFQMYDVSQTSSPSDTRILQNCQSNQQSSFSVQDGYESNNMHGIDGRQRSTSNCYDQYQGQYVHTNLERPQADLNEGINHYASDPQEQIYNTEAGNQHEQSIPCHNMQSKQQYVDVPELCEESGQTISYDLQNNQQYSQVSEDQSGQSVPYDTRYTTEGNTGSNIQYNEDYDQVDSQQYYQNYSQEYMQQYISDQNYDGQYVVPNEEHNQPYPEEAYDNNNDQSNYSQHEEQLIQQSGVRDLVSESYQPQSVKNYSEYYSETESNKVGSTNLESDEVPSVVGTLAVDIVEPAVETGQIDHHRQHRVLDILDTDTESSKKNISKTSNDSDFDFNTN